MERISVIIPVYNVENYLRKCLSSIAAQTHTNLEIICINDGSTDGSLAICQEFAAQDSRFRIIDQANRGLAAVRNRGIQEARCDYLAFIDSDDYVDADFIEKLYHGLKEHDADICVSNVQYENMTRQFCLINDLSTNKSILNRVETMQEFLNPTGGLGNYIVNKLYKRAVFDGIVFPESRLFEDAFTMYRILNNVNKAVIEQNTYYHYWIRDDSITGQYSPESNNFDLLNANKAKAHFVCENYPELASLVFQQYFTAFSWFVNKSALLKIDNNMQLREYLSDLVMLKNRYGIALNIKQKLAFTVMRISLPAYRMAYSALRGRGETNDT